jgi:hypothetical protein
MAIVLDGTSGITTPALDSTARFATADMPLGSVIQVVQNVIPAASYITTTGTNIQTQLTASITPTSSSSKILVLMNYMVGTASTVNSMVTARLYRDASSIFYLGQISGNVVSDRAVTNVSHSYLDSPNTTTSTTYTLHVTSVDGATIYIGAWGSNPAAWNSSTFVTLMEIAA